jgi:molecular chaperone HscB
MASPNFQQNYFELFGVPKIFDVDQALLSERFRQLQGQLHPDRYAGKSQHEQRVAVQYSAFVNQAYTTIKNPLERALYLLELAGMNSEQVAAEKIDGGFLIEQMELREKIESIADMVDPETALEHLMTEIAQDTKNHEREFVEALSADALNGAASACVKMQFLKKLHQEAEQIEAGLLN